MPAPSRQPLIIALCCAIGLSICVLVWSLARIARAEARAASAIAQNSTRPPAEVARAVAALKLISVEIDTTVRVERGEASWRGDVRAHVEVPVRLHYGVDLSRMDVSRVAFLPEGAGGRYVVTLPRPQRLATEVFSESERAEVETGWLRLRAQSGEYYLSQARKDVPQEARELTLLPKDQSKVEETTLSQVESLVRAVVGDTPHIVVRFDDALLEPAPDPAQGTGP